MDVDYSHYHRDKDYQKYEGTFRNIFRSRFNLISKFAKMGSVLDIGCSSGIFLDLFKEKGYETWGIEPSDNAKIAEAKGHKVSKSFFEKSTLPENYFDVVVLNHTLEHMDDPVGVLKKAHKLLKAGGVLYVDVPNAGGIAATVLGKYWPYLAPDEHKWQFRRKTLEKVFTDSGFKPIYFTSRSGLFEFANPLLELRRKRFVIDLLTLPFSLMATALKSGDSMSLIGGKL